MQNSRLFEFINLSVFSVFLLGIFLLSAVALLTVFTYLNKRQEDFGWMAALSLGLGPALLSWLFTMTLWVFPGQQPYFYVLGIVAVFGLLALLRPRYLYQQTKQAISSHFKRFDNWMSRLLLAIVTFLIGSILFGLLLVGIFLPMFGNDPLEYAQAARLLAEARSVAIYPFVDSALSGGFYAPLTHPLGYINLMTFANMLQGETVSAGIIRFIAPYYAMVSAIAIWGFASRTAALAGPLAALLLIATPIYFELSAQSHIDTMRIFTFMAAFIALYHHIKRPGFGSAIIVGLAVGMSHFTHSIGILTLPILVPIYLITSGVSFKKTVLYLGTIIVIGIALILPRWVVNISVFGSLVADQVKVWSIPEVYFAEYLAAVRQLVTPLDKIYFGLLKGFSFPSQFGVGYYLFVFALAWLIKERMPHKNIEKIWKERQFLRPEIVVFSLWVLAGFYGIVFLSILLDMDLIIKNSRYILTVQPFISVVIACVTAELLTKKFDFYTDKMNDISFSFGSKKQSKNDE